MSKIQEIKTEICVVQATISELTKKRNELISQVNNPGTPDNPNVECNHTAILNKLISITGDIDQKVEELTSMQSELLEAYADHAHELLADKQEEIDNIQSDLDKANAKNLQHDKFSYDRECRYHAAMEVVETAVHAVDRLDNWMHDEEHFSSLSDAADATRCIYNTLVHCLKDKDLRYQMPCYIPTSRNVDIVTNED